MYMYMYLELRNILTSMWLLITASWRGVSPPIPAALTLAPLSMRSMTALMCPWLQASCNGVQPRGKIMKERKIHTEHVIRPNTVYYEFSLLIYMYMYNVYLHGLLC